MIEGDGLIAEVRADLSYQSGVQRDGDGVRGAGEHFPLDGSDFGVIPATNLEEVDLGVALAADAINTISVRVEARDVLAAVAKGTNQLKGAPARLARPEEQGLDFADHGSLLVRFSILLYCDNVVICAFGQLTTKIIAALHIAGPLVYAGIGEAFAIRLGDIEFAVSGVFGETLFFGHGLDLFRVEAILGVIEVDIVVEAPDIRVERRDVVSELHGDPLMGGKCGEQPGLVVVGDDDLVVGADALIIDQAAEKLDALAGRGALAQDDAAVTVLAQTHFLIDEVCCSGLLVIGGA